MIGSVLTALFGIIVGINGPSDLHTWSAFLTHYLRVYHRAGKERSG